MPGGVWISFTCPPPNSSLTFLQTNMLQPAQVLAKFWCCLSKTKRLSTYIPHPKKNTHTIFNHIHNPTHPKFYHVLSTCISPSIAAWFVPDAWATTSRCARRVSVWRSSRPGRLPAESASVLLVLKKSGAFKHQKTRDMWGFNVSLIVTWLVVDLPLWKILVSSEYDSQ